MKPHSRKISGVLSVMLAGASAVALSVPLQVMSTVEAAAAVVRAIEVRGNQRISDDAVRSYTGIRIGSNATAADIDEATKALFNTGLFSDVHVNQSGSTLVVTVAEQAIVNQTIFQGNKKIKDRDLAGRVQLQSRSPFSKYAMEADVEAIRDAYRAIGRNDVSVNAETMDAGDGRVNVIFNIAEGGRTKIDSVTFAGNQAYGDTRLRSIITTKRSSILSRFLRDDVYSDDRLRSDEDRLRRYYYDHGYADFRVISSSAEFNAGNNAYDVSFTVDEGARYRYGDVTIDSTIPEVDTTRLSSLVKTRAGSVYSARDVEKTLIALSEELASEGFAFAQVTPRGDRDFANNTISITYTIDQGPRVYVERIEIRGNDRTRDYVIRREFDLSEGDAFNQVIVQKARQRLEDLGYFSRVNISTVPGSEPDRVVLVVDVEEQSTGDIGIGAGYSVGGSDDGVLLEGSISDSNFLGRGQYVKLAVGGSSSSRTYTLSFTEPYFMGSRISAGFDIQRATNSYTNYDAATSLASVRFGLPITDALSAQLAYTYSEEEYTCATGVDCSLAGTTVADSIAQAIASSPWKKSAVSATLTYNTLDNRRDPREGLFMRGTVEFAGLGGDAEYLKAFGSASYYHLLSEEMDIVGLVAVGGGHVEETSSGGLRAFDLFNSSKTIIRGFDSNGIGPYDLTTGEHIGANSYFRATAEAQFPLPFIPESLGIRGAVFADAATMFGNTVQTTNVGGDSMKWRASVGAGLTWASPFGPLRVDYAIPVKKEASDKVQEFSFGVSTRF